MYRYHGYGSGRVVWINRWERGKSVDQADYFQDNSREGRNTKVSPLSIGWESIDIMDTGLRGCSGRIDWRGRNL